MAPPQSFLACVFQEGAAYCYLSSSRETSEWAKESQKREARPSYDATRKEQA